jgi:hypothetical protein
MQKILVFIMFALLFLVGCGGGDGTPSSTTATLKISLSGTLPASTAIAGAGFTLKLPADVTPAMVNGLVAGSVITPSGTFSGGTALPTVYTPATATAAGTVKFALANATPAGVTQPGEVATVVLQLTNSAVPTAASFALDPLSVTVIDILGNPVSGLQAVVSEVQLQ